MCHYITLIVASADEGALDRFMRRSERRAKPLDNPSVRRVLHEDERQYLTTVRHCDCGTVLARPQAELSGEALEAERGKQAAQLRRRGWSAAKIERWFSDRDKGSPKKMGGVDSFELWAGVLEGLLLEEGLPRAGLLLGDYRGSVETETFNSSRKEVAIEDLRAALKEMRPWEVVMVTRAPASIGTRHA
jgi:hypothetical protein